MSTLIDFQALLDKERIRSFTAAEVFFRGGSDERLRINSEPPRDLWPKIIPTLRVLDALRTKLGCPIKLISIYRNVAYNRAIGGEPRSYHTRFQACDFHATRGTPRQWRDALRTMRAAGVFSGGLGLYPTFVHVDTRGYPANW